MVIDETVIESGTARRKLFAVNDLRLGIRSLVGVDRG